ncbi:hypothetical protein OX283_006250 [Flavobacterium sp. SUN052]|uniref:hypothetical protein n=1 Tax=Flavobacterium sp. SUN052 TaxID=3002441 RepID=UPI00237D50D0|nr:hypothetical protein [Flavobacterium sp. SUN052]MEC4004249.1 hypothetical protein [Flavobacterium sp. SUN052]
MNNSRKVIILILVVTIIQLTLSVFSKEFIDYYPYFKNVNLLSDILVKEKSKNTSSKKNKKAGITVVDGVVVNDFDAFVKKGTLIRFNADTLQPALTKFNEKLIALSEGKNVKIRIAWFGDSQIEGDFITQDIREMLQNYFGEQKGVGYVPITSISADFRKTAKLVATGTVEADNFKKSNSNSQLFFSGYSFFSDDLDINFSDNSRKNPNQVTQKWLLYGKGDSISVTIQDSIRKYPANKNFNRILVGSSTSSKAKLSVASNKTPIYGISSEPQSGIVLDNFSFRGITGVELKKVNSDLLAEINKSGYYDLIVFQYGVNLMFKPDDTDYEYYYRAMRPVLKKFKNNMPNTEFLLFSCSDRAFNYDGEWKTAVGIDSLIHTQARLAYDNDIPFYNFYNSIGGKGTVVKWADSTLQLANKDYIHFNFRGAKVAAKIIFKAIIHDYEKAVKWKKENKPFTEPKLVTPKLNETKPVVKEVVIPKTTTAKKDSSKSSEPKEIVPNQVTKKVDSL